MRFKKRGLSPVIATMLLISLAMVLAVIIFFWARSFIGESISKQGSAIDLLCDDVKFRADANFDSKKINVENIGDISIYGIEVRKEGFGEITAVSTINGADTITGGQTKTFDLPDGINSGDKVLLVPTLLGEANGGTKAHTCSKDYGVEVVVS